jgi:competence ComEA-like helix-hairpin-helix protein
VQHDGVRSEYFGAIGHVARLHRPLRCVNLTMKRLWVTILIRIQESLRCTRREALVLSAVLGLYAAGTLVQYVRMSARPWDDAFYAPDDSVFQALSRADLGSADTPVVDLITDTLDIPPDFPLDINLASESDLRHLPGIGPALAGRIVAWRSEHGRFASTADLTAISGIGPKTLEKLEDLVVVRDSSATRAKDIRDPSGPP